MARRRNDPAMPDADAAVSTYLAALDAAGLSERMGPDELARRSGSIRAALAESDPKVVETREVTWERGRRVETVTASMSGSSQGFEIAPIRDATGRIDVEASVLNDRLVREALLPDLSGLRPTVVQRMLLRFLTWRSRAEAGEGADASWAEVEAQVDALVREGYERARADEEGSG